MRLYGGIMRVNLLKSGVVGASIAVLVAAAGCGTNSASTTTSPSIFGLSSTVSALASPDVQIFNVEAAGTPSAGRGPCMFDQGSGRFGCDDARRKDLNFTRTVT